MRVTSFNSNPRLHPSLAPLILIAQSHGGVLSSTEARELGYSSRRLDTLARRGAITKFLGQWIVPSLVEHHHLAVAHALMFRIGPQTVVSGAAAAQCLGAIGEWPVRFGVDIPTAYPPSRSHMRIEGVRIVRRAMDGVVVPRGQLRLADRTTALLDCVDSVQSDMREGLLDFLLQQRWLKRELVETRIAARRSGQTGRRVTSAQLAAQRHALEGTESAAERLFKRVLVGAGLRRGGSLGWHPNHTVRIALGSLTKPATNSQRRHPKVALTRIVRIDFAWPDCRLAIEVDGRAFHSSDEAFERDRERRNDLEVAGWMVLNVTWKALRGSSESVGLRIHAARSRRRATR